MKRKKQSESERIFREGLMLRDSRLYEEAIEAFVSLLSLPNAQAELVVQSHVQIGSLYRSLDSQEMRIRHFREATLLDPNNELASVGYYHSIISTGDWRAALEEMLRYVSQNDSSWYRDLLAEGYDYKNLPFDLAELAERARAMLKRHVPAQA